MTIHHSHARSDHFSYEGFGSTPEEAAAALRLSLEAHAASMGGVRASDDDDGVHPDFVRETLEAASTDTIGAGQVRFIPSVGHGVTDSPAPVASLPDPGEASWRSFRDIRMNGEWGTLDAFGSTEELAKAALAYGGALALRRDPTSTWNLSDEDVETYAFETGHGYRGGYDRTFGEPLTHPEAAR